MDVINCIVAIQGDAIPGMQQSVKAIAAHPLPVNHLDLDLPLPIKNFPSFG